MHRALRQQSREHTPARFTSTHLKGAEELQRDSSECVSVSVRMPGARERPTMLRPCFEIAAQLPQLSCLARRPAHRNNSRDTEADLSALDCLTARTQAMPMPMMMPMCVQRSSNTTAVAAARTVRHDDASILLANERSNPKSTALNQRAHELARARMSTRLNTSLCLLCCFLPLTGSRITTTTTAMLTLGHAQV